MSYDETWKAMNAVEEAFTKISGLEFLVERLHKAVKDDDTTNIIDITDAIAAYLPVYSDNFDEKFQNAWKVTIGKGYGTDHITDHIQFTKSMIKYDIDD